MFNRYKHIVKNNYCTKAFASFKSKICLITNFFIVQKLKQELQKDSENEITKLLQRIVCTTNSQDLPIIVHKHVV